MASVVGVYVILGVSDMCSGISRYLSFVEVVTVASQVHLCEGVWQHACVLWQYSGMSWT